MDSNTDCESEKIRMLDASVRHPSLSSAVHSEPYGQLAASLIAINSVMCASACSELATVLEMRACDVDAHKVRARAVRSSSLLASSEKVISLMMLKWRIFNAYIVLEVAISLLLKSRACSKLLWQINTVRSHADPRPFIK